MNIRELKEYIKDLPDDTLVLRDGYEGGYDTLEAPTEKSVAHIPDNSWYYGRYEDYEGRGTEIKAFLF